MTDSTKLMVFFGIKSFEKHAHTFKKLVVTSNITWG